MAFMPMPKTYAFASKIEAIDFVGTIMCCGDTKGIVTLNQLKIVDNAIEIQFVNRSEPLKKKVTKVEILKLTKHVSVISNGQLYILDPMTLEVNNNFLKDVNTITVNNNGWIAANSGKQIYFFVFKPEENTFKRQVIGKRSDIVVEDNVLKLGILFFNSSVEWECIRNSNKERLYSI